MPNPLLLRLARKWCLVGSLAVVAAFAPAQSGMLTVIGSAPQVMVPDSPALVPSTGYTVEAWFYFNPNGPGGAYSPTILRKNIFTPSYLLRVTEATGGNLQFYANTGGSPYAVTSSVSTPLNSWHHMAGTHDGLVARLFLDGVQVGSTPVTGPPGFMAGALLIASGNTNNEYWRGSIDEVRLWSYPKTASQIQETMFFERDNVPGLVAAWHFNTNYLDSTGGHNGIPNNHVTIQPSTSPVRKELMAPAVSPIGAPLVFDLESTHTMQPYIMDVSVTGNSPGIYIPAPIDKTLPLNQPLVYLTYGSYFDSLFNNFFGFTNANGQAAPVLHVPPMPELIGAPIWGSFVLLDVGAPFGILQVGNGTTTILADFPPVIASVSPGTSPQSGGAAVSILGNHFQPGTTVTIGTSSALGVTVVNSQTITCTSPTQTLGPKNVTVTTPAGFSATASNAINYVANLVLGAITPPAVAAGASVTIAGSGFQPGVTVTVGGVSATVTSVAANSVTWTVPPAITCDALVTVTNPDSQTQSATWNQSPLILTMVGATGPAAGGTNFSILGANLFPGTTVTIGGTPATILNSTQTTMSVQSPPGSPGPAALVLSSVTGCTAAGTFIYQ